MVSGFFTSPCDHSRIFSGLASEMRIAENESGSLGFSKKLKMSRTGGTSEAYDGIAERDLNREAGRRGGLIVGFGHNDHLRFFPALCGCFLHSSSAAAASPRELSPSMSSTLRQSDWSSLMRTLKLSGRPASRV